MVEQTIELENVQNYVDLDSPKELDSNKDDHSNSNHKHLDYSDGSEE